MSLMSFFDAKRQEAIGRMVDYTDCTKRRCFRGVPQADVRMSLDVTLPGISNYTISEVRWHWHPQMSDSDRWHQTWGNSWHLD